MVIRYTTNGKKRVTRDLDRDLNFLYYFIVNCHFESIISFRR